MGLKRFELFKAVLILGVNFAFCLPLFAWAANPFESDFVDRPANFPIADTGKTDEARNSFQYFLGFVLPKDGSFQGASGDRYKLENGTGVRIQLGYSRKFGQFSLGVTFPVESFGHKALSDIPIIGSLPADGRRTSIGCMLKSGWQPDFGDWLLKTELNIGVAQVMNQLSLGSRSFGQSKLVFAYEAGLGFGYAWSNSFQTLVRYNVLGQGDVGRFDKSLSHAIGIELSSVF
jgi:hypothetical protein